MTNPDAKWFDRPHKTECCPRCRGSGVIDLGYALTAAERVTDAPNNAIRAFVVGMSSIFEACREAESIATAAGRPVAFEFNSSTVVVRSHDDPDQIARQWWQKTYNETPERTMTHR